MSQRGLPDGGKYTRPRRGYRSKSKYRLRLARRGLKPTEVHYESLAVIRARQIRDREANDGRAS